MQAITVAAAAVAEQEQSIGVIVVAPPQALPPAPDGVASQLARVGAAREQEEAFVPHRVVHSVGNQPLLAADEIMIGELLLRIELLNLRREYPMRAETLMYISPPKEFRFRVVQVIRGGRPGQAFCSVNNDILIGREGCDMNFGEDRHVSKKHCRLTWQNGKVLVSDLDSRNGTMVRINDEQRLSHADYVVFGTELMRVEINV